MSQQREKHAFLQGRPYYQSKTGDGLSSGKKYFYSPGDSRGRQAALLKSQQATSMQAGAGAKFKIVPYVGEFDGKGVAASKPGKATAFPTWGPVPYSTMHGGAVQWNRRNTQTPEKVEELKVKYAGKAHPDFVERYADILAQRPKMNGWPAYKPSNLWTGEERAAYVRDGSPKSKADIIRIMGTWGNARDY